MLEQVALEKVIRKENIGANGIIYNLSVQLLAYVGDNEINDKRDIDQCFLG